MKFKSLFLSTCLALSTPIVIPTVFNLGVIEAYAANVVEDPIIKSDTRCIGFSFGSYIWGSIDSDGIVTISINKTVGDTSADGNIYQAFPEMKGITIPKEFEQSTVYLECTAPELQRVEFSGKLLPGYISFNDAYIHEVVYNTNYRSNTNHDDSFQYCSIDKLIVTEDAKFSPFGRSYYGDKVKVNTLEIHGSGFFGNLDVDTVRYYADSTKSCYDFDNVYKFYDFTGDITSENFINNEVSKSTQMYVYEDSTTDVLLHNIGRTHLHINEDNLYGKRPSLKQEGFMFDAKSPKDLKYRVDLGKKPDGADDVKSVTVDNAIIDEGSWEFNDTDYITIYKNFLTTLSNGTHTIGVEFDNGVYSAGATVTIINSTIPGGGNGQEPPEALDTIKYEFYKDYPDYAIIPVKLNGASAITQLKIGTEIVDPANYKLQDGAIILDKNYLSTLEPAKYRVLPTFNDANQTTITNLQLIVYEKAADRAAPYLLQSRIIFDGSDVVLTFDPGEGDLETTNVLALVIDDDIVLPNGETLPLSGKNVKGIQRAFEESFELDEPFEDKDLDDDMIATPSDVTYDDTDRYVKDDGTHMAKKEKRLYKRSTILTDLSNGADTVFTVEDCVIALSGDYVTDMNLSEGEHLIGAIFDNTEKTTDLKKVILTIEGSGDGNDDNKPVDPEDPNQPVDPENPNGGGDNKPIDPENPNRPTDPEKPGKPGDPDEGGGGSSGGSGGGGGSSNGGSGGGNTNTGGPGDNNNNNKLPDGSLNPDFKPIIPDDGGRFEGSGNDWTYIKPDGSHAKDEWVSSGGDWYYIGEDGKLEYDWCLDKRTNKWYMLNREHDGKFGAVRLGWYYEKQDDKWYFLNPINGDMLLDWQFIGGKWYFFTPANKGQTYFGDNVNGWYYKPDVEVRPLGSMYSNEKTSDGYMVDGTGAWIK